MLEVDRGMKDQEEELLEKVIKIDRINKVVKGGKRMAFRAFVIVGNRNGKVGVALGKSKEVPLAIRKGFEKAKRKLLEVAIVNGTLPHPVTGHFSASRVIMKPAKRGTGVIAGGAVRVLFEALGVKDVVAKCYGSNNPFNATKAVLAGLSLLKNVEQEEKIRGVKLPVYIEKPAVEKPQEDKKTDKKEGKPEGKSNPKAKPTENAQPEKVETAKNTQKDESKNDPKLKGEDKKNAT